MFELLPPWIRSFPSKKRKGENRQSPSKEAAERRTGTKAEREEEIEHSDINITVKNEPLEQPPAPSVPQQPDDFPISDAMNT